MRLNILKGIFSRNKPGSEITRKTKVVLDTNILVAGFFNKGSYSFRILELIKGGILKNIWSRAIRKEAEMILNQIPPVKRGYIKRVKSLIFKEEDEIRNPPQIDLIKEDPQDNKLIACTLGGKVKFLVTNDRHLLKHNGYNEIEILTPAQFLKKIKQEETAPFPGSPDAMVLISIVIPLKRINNYFRESIAHILNLDYNNFEVLVFPDIETQEKFKKARIIPTGRVGPAEKRNLSLKYAKGEILAFLDDDAYPRSDWLKNAARHFGDLNVAAVGGPAVTPKNDSFWQKVSGAVFLSKLSGGNPERYWPIGKVREIDDWPSVNLFVRKSDFLAVGGFNPKFWPGEDSILCRDLIKKLNKKIVYDPSVLVWHHRRQGLKKHLVQIGRYGLHRGYFAKTYPENSLRFRYFLPTLFCAFIIFGWLLLFLPGFLKFIYLGLWLLYILALLVALLSIYNKIRDFSVSLAALGYIFLTHFYYGWQFIRGFVFTNNLKSKLKQ